MSTYKAVLIGLTGIGARRPAEPNNLPMYQTMPRSHANAYYRHPRTELVGVCDIRQDALDGFKKDWGDVMPNVHYYTNYREMYEKEKPDFVSVATSDHLHAQMTVDAAEMGAKAILCEKPIATTLEDADRMIAAAEKHGALLSIEHTRRWNPLYHKARELIRSGELGRLRTVTVNMYSRRSMLFRNGTHIIDLINFFAESDPQWVVAELEEGFEHFTVYKSDGGKDPAKDPAASAYIRYANGVRGFYNSVKTDFPGSDEVMACDGGIVSTSDRGASVTRGKSYLEIATGTLVPDEFMHTQQLGAVAELVHVLENGGQLVSSGREARKTLEIMLAILKSHHAGNVRVNLPLQ